MSAVALYRPRRVAATLVLVHALLLMGIFALAAPGELPWDGLIALIALDATMVSSGWLVRSERKLQQAARERERAAAKARLEEARHAERERIARELHDVLAHRLSLLAVYAGALRVRVTALPEEREAAEVIRQGAFAALEELRQVIWVARDPSAAELDSPQPTLDDLPALLEESGRAGTEVAVDGELGGVPDSVGRHVYRVVQEGLTNARKHAPGQPVHLRLSTNGGIEVELTNAYAPSEGEAAVPGAGAGLAGLRERVTLLGGRLSFGGTPEGRFRLHAWIPSQS
jgi:signal transduction histidine kinase